MVPKGKTGPANKNEKSLPIGIGFIGHMCDSGASVADVSNGRLVRIRPLHWDWKIIVPIWGSRGRTKGPSRYMRRGI